MKKIVLFASLLAIAASCAKVEEPEVKAPNYTLFAEVATTKASIDDESGAMMWTAGDKITALSLVGSTSTPSELTLVGGPTKNGSFSGTVTGTPTVAIYPANGNHAINSNNTVDVVLPSEYTWSEGMVNAPMLASIVSDAELTSGTAKFAHMGGLMKITYLNVPSSARCFGISATKSISGTFEDISVESPVLSAGAATNTNVFFDFTTPSKDMSFYVPVPCGEFGFSVALYSDSGTTKIADSERSITKASISLGKYYILPDIEFEGASDDTDDVTIVATENFNSTKCLTDASKKYGSANSFVSIADGKNLPTEYVDGFDYSWSVPFEASKTTVYSQNIFDGGIKLGASSKPGIVTNNDMLIDVTGSFTVRIYASSWSGTTIKDTDYKDLSVTYNGEVVTKKTQFSVLDANNSVYSPEHFTSYLDYTFTKSSSNEFSISVDSGSRVLIDKVEIISGGTSTDSPDTPVTPDVPTVLNDPSNVKCIDNGQNETSLTFTWDAVDGAVGYLVKIDDGEWTTPSGNLTHTVTQLTKNTEYTLYVKAVAADSENNSEGKASATGKTKSDAYAVGTFVFNTDAGLSALGIKKPSNSQGTNLGTLVVKNGDVSISFTDGNSATRVWNSSGTTDLRVYKTTGSITLSSDKNITKIVFTGSNIGKFTPSVGSISGSVWTGNTTVVKFTATDTVQIRTITVGE